jgi:hypothetical protein
MRRPFADQTGANAALVEKLDGAVHYCPSRRVLRRDWEIRTELTQQGACQVVERGLGLSPHLTA